MTEKEIHRIAKEIAKGWAIEKMSNPNEEFLDRLPKSIREI